jgi:hypothetical protein
MDDEQVTTVSGTEEQQSGQQAETLTAEQLQTVLDNSLLRVRETNNNGFDQVSQDIQSLGDRLSTLYETRAEDAEQDTEVVYTVRLDAGQVDTFRSAARVACTEGLLVVILLAVMCGLTAWRELARSWRNG